jgi:hypothetical protein
VGLWEYGRVAAGFRKISKRIHRTESRMSNRRGTAHGSALAVQMSYHIDISELLTRKYQRLRKLQAFAGCILAISSFISSRFGP